MSVLVTKKAQAIIDRNVGWNAKAVIEALEFMEEMPAGQALTLQVTASEDIPYIKRIVLSVLGEPSRFISSRGMSYSGKIIQIVSIRNPHHDEYTRGYRGPVIYIPRINHKYEEMGDPAIADIVEDWRDAVPYTMWQECGLSLADVYNLVCEDAGGSLDVWQLREWCIYVSERG